MVHFLWVGIPTVIQVGMKTKLFFFFICIFYNKIIPGSPVDTAYMDGEDAGYDKRMETEYASETIEETKQLAEKFDSSYANMEPLLNEMDSDPILANRDDNEDHKLMNDERLNSNSVEDEEVQLNIDSDTEEDDNFKLKDDSDHSNNANNPEYRLEAEAGDKADLFGTNQHHYVPSEYTDFSRRFVLQYPYKERFQRQDNDNALIVKKTSPELVLAVAKQSALLEASKPVSPDDEGLQRDMLRSGDYWNGVWKDVIPSEALRSPVKLKGSDKSSMSKLETVRVQVMPGSQLYRLVSLTKDISPRLLYVVNSKNKD